MINLKKISLRKMKLKVQICFCMLGKLRQEEFEGSLGVINRPCLNHTRKAEGGGRKGSRSGGGKG